MTPEHERVVRQMVKHDGKNPNASAVAALLARCEKAEAERDVMRETANMLLQNYDEVCDERNHMRDERDEAKAERDAALAKLGEIIDARRKRPEDYADSFALDRIDAAIASTPEIVAVVDSEVAIAGKGSTHWHHIAVSVDLPTKTPVRSIIVRRSE